MSFLGSEDNVAGSPSRDRSLDERFRVRVTISVKVSDVVSLLFCFKAEMCNMITVIDVFHSHVI